MPYLVQKKHNDTVNVGSISVTLDNPITPGNLLVASVTVHAAWTSPTHPWGLAAPDLQRIQTAVASLFSKVAGVGESTTISCSSTIVRNWGITVYEVAPGAGRTWIGLDKTSVAGANSAQSLASGATPAQAEEDNFAVLALALNQGVTVASQGVTNGYAIDTAASGSTRGFAATKFLSDASATSLTSSWTLASNAASALGTYRATPAPKSAAFLAFL